MTEIMVHDRFPIGIRGLFGISTVTGVTTLLALMIIISAELGSRDSSFEEEGVGRVGEIVRRATSIRRRRSGQGLVEVCEKKIMLDNNPLIDSPGGVGKSSPKDESWEAGYQKHVEEREAVRKKGERERARQ